MQECQDFVRGCTFLGTGGGGPPERGLSVLRAALEAGRPVGWVDVAEIPDDAWTCTAFGMGSIAPRKPLPAEELDRYGLQEGPWSLASPIRELEREVGVKISVVVPSEIGGSNTPGPVNAASELGIVAVDGDYCGRAVPEITQGTSAITGKPGWPLAAVDRWGNVSVIKKAASLPMSERIGKMLAVAAFGGVGMAGTLLQARDMKAIVVPNTLTRSYQLGRAIREAREKALDPAQEVAQVGGGWVLFRGKVVRREWEDRDGYMFGTHELDGVQEWQGHRYRVWFKNENHACWLDGEPHVTSPDIIAVVELESGEPKTNTMIAEGDLLALVGLPAAAVIFRSPAGIEALGPRHFGFDIDYVPIEDRLQVGV
ncbi:MAG: DUF917 domain-containing protein [Armatimonadetes bacterium]|nr:DUF917 domain-containing protein [Armatimonadota bacterium]